MALDGKHIWTTPFECMLSQKLNLANLQVFGCCTYVWNAKVLQGKKMASQAWIGYLVGFVASNVWKIWNPCCQEVVEECDVVFNKSLFYDPDLPLPEDIPVNLPPPVVEILQLPPAIKEADEIVEDDPLPLGDTESTQDSHLTAIHESPASSTTDSSCNKPHLPMTPNHTPLPANAPLEQSGEDYSEMPILQPPQIPGAFNEHPSPIHETGIDPFFIPSLQESVVEENDSATQQLSSELIDHSPEPSSNNLPIVAGGEPDANELNEPNVIHSNTAG